GGGVRGLSELIILEAVMEKIKVTNGLKEAPLPCEYFDLIGGTSTGGVIAIMLGRLRMTVNDCIHAYKSLAALAFTPKARWNLPGSPDGQFSTMYLEKALKLAISQQCQKKGCEYTSCEHSEHLFRDMEGCKTVVLAAKKDDISGPPTLFKTYSTDPQMAECKIWEVARATSAATTYFRSIACGRDQIEFVDAAIAGYNNPCRILLDEAHNTFPKCRPSEFTILSIGSGAKKSIAIKDSRTSILLALKDMASDSDRVAIEMYTDLNREKYHRFTCANGLGDIKLSKWMKNHTIASLTHDYLDNPDQKRRIEACAKALIADKVTGRQAVTSRWRRGLIKLSEKIR
ncbi:hypothetical protein HYALB_00010772, partial [Hymenoscyphus albidus]